MNKTYYVGLDVHKESIAVTFLLLTLPKALSKQLDQKLKDLKVCYEAGPNGFVLALRIIIPTFTAMVAIS